MGEKTKVQREHKDRLFIRLFSQKESAIHLFNAIFETDYKPEEIFEFNTLENFLYIEMRNDISFLLANIEVLYEHQSTYNPNMPLRSLFYITKQLRRYVDINKINFWSSKLTEIPVPICVVFYNGTKAEPDRFVQYLSDAYPKLYGQLKPSIDVRVLCININKGHNCALMERCKILSEYSEFIATFRDYIAHYSIEQAADLAVEECIKKNVLKDLLSAHRAEVKEMLFEEYDQDYIHSL